MQRLGFITRRPGGLVYPACSGSARVEGDTKTPQRSSLWSVNISHLCYFKACVKIALNPLLSSHAGVKPGSANVD